MIIQLFWNYGKSNEKSEMIKCERVLFCRPENSLDVSSDIMIQIINAKGDYQDLSAEMIKFL